MNWKKVVSVLLVSAMTLSMAACGDSASSSDGAAATGTNGVAAAVSPAVNVIKSETIAKVGTGTYTLTGAMNVTAKDVTKIVIVSGGAAGSTSKERS